MKTTLVKNDLPAFGPMRHLSILIPRLVNLMLFALTLVNLGAAGLIDIGSGDPGLKVATRETNASEVVIYQDEPISAGIGGLGGIENRTINVIFDQGHHFKATFLKAPMGYLPKQLYPFGVNAAFTSEIGAVDPNATQAVANGDKPPWSVGYKFIDGQLTIFTNVQAEAAIRYHLKNDEIFLGLVDGRVFFCKRGLHPAIVFCRGQDSQNEYYFKMPRKVVDIFGVTKGIERDVGFVVLQKATWHLHPAPFEPQFVQFSLSDGKLYRH